MGSLVRFESALGLTLNRLHAIRSSDLHTLPVAVVGTDPVAWRLHTSLRADISPTCISAFSTCFAGIREH